MSLNAYFSKVVGQKQGQFKGGTIERKPADVAPKPTEPAKKKKPADSFEPAVRSPRDPASGQATGKRTHKPLAASFPYAPSSQTGEATLSPRDAASGLPTGKRSHKPFAVAAPRDAVTGFNTGKRNY